MPFVSFVLDHMGKPEIKENRLESWHEQIRQIASFPNVMCKVSGLLTQADHIAWNEDQIMPLIEHAIDCFGADRVLFGSDWRVLELAATYRQWVDVVDRATQHLSRMDRLKIFRTNAIRIYRLDV